MLPQTRVSIKGFLLGSGGEQVPYGQVAQAVAGMGDPSIAGQVKVIITPSKSMKPDEKLQFLVFGL